jgi:hypothetical protein
MRKGRDRRDALRTRLTGLAAASLAIGALAAPSAAGHVQGSYARTGDMAVPRSGATAAPLADGRVLVAGGHDPTNFDVVTVLHSAEIFDPRTGTFSPTGSMTVPRDDAASAPLPDGRVLIAGGNNTDQPSHALKSAEIFDPATGSFTPTGDMSVARNEPVAAPLPDGRVLVAGGDFYEESAEIFDPRTGTFSPTGSMAIHRDGAVAAPLPYGRVVVLGGTLDQSAEIFDAATGRFNLTGGPTPTLWTAAAAPLPDGRVLVAGGGQDFGVSGRIFDPLTATFASTPSMTTGRYEPAAAPLADGRVLVAGTSPIQAGLDPVGPLKESRSAELFKPDLSYRLDGRRLTVSVAVAGRLFAAAAKSGRGASAAAGKSRPPLKPARRKGGPGVISFKLAPVGKAKRRLERRGRLRVRATLNFVPKRVKGNCVTEFSPCFTSNYAISKTVLLTLKAKRHKRP